MTLPDGPNVPVSPCLKCGRKLDTAGYLWDPFDEPQIGDFTLCTYCGHMMIFGRGMVLRNPTILEMHEVQSGPDFRATKAFVDQLRRNRQ